MTVRVTGRRQSGVALALLLWMLAGLSLLVAGILSISRSDVQLTALQLDQARAQAVATGIAHAALRDLYALSLSGTNQVGGIQQGSYALAGYDVRISIIPAGGLVNINAAGPEVFSPLFQFAGGLQEEAALTLAEAVVEWRSGGPAVEGAATAPDVGRGPFRVEEELLEVPGMTRDLYDGIRRYVHAYAGAGGALDLLVAPESLLNGWRSIDPEAVDFALQSRQDDVRNEAPAGPALPSGLAGGGVYCLEIDVRIAEGRIFRQRIWADMSAGAGGLPWRFRRVYPLTMLPANSDEAQFAI